VDHLDEVARTGRAGVDIALFRARIGVGSAVGGALDRAEARGQGIEDGSIAATASSGPPTIMLKPRSKPQTPPEVPTST
jgi:hypothetical protein